jgi:hypothetical protein
MALAPTPFVLLLRTKIGGELLRIPIYILHITLHIHKQVHMYTASSLWWKIVAYQTEEAEKREKTFFSLCLLFAHA